MGPEMLLSFISLPAIMDSTTTAPRRTIEDVMKDIDALNRRLSQRMKALDAHLGKEPKTVSRRSSRKLMGGT